MPNPAAGFYSKGWRIGLAEPFGGEYGDWWTWVAIDADTKLVPSYRVGPRDSHEARQFMGDLAKRLRHRVQLTTDGFRPYLLAVEEAFEGEVDYAILTKLYGTEGQQGRFSPPRLIGTHQEKINGNPKPEGVSTSYIERQNLTIRMSMRRFTRLTNALSKKVENLAAAVSLHFAYYNLCRPHKSLNGKTPAMVAGVTDHPWTLAELIGLLEAAEATPVRRGSYRKTRERREAARRAAVQTDPLPIHRV